MAAPMHCYLREKHWHPLYIHAKIYTRENLYPRKLSIDAVFFKTRKFNTAKISTHTVLLDFLISCNLLCIEIISLVSLTGLN